MSTPSSNDTSDFTRRDFVKKGTLGGAAIGLGSLAIPVAHAQGAGKKKLKVGVVGLGGRGSGAVTNILQADPDTILWAAADIEAGRLNRIENYKKKFNGRIDVEGRVFVGFDAYQKVIDSGVDIVLLTSTPVFRPLHFEAAVAAGKHVFMEKPFAIDIPGLRSIIENAKKAKDNGQSVLTGLVWRYSTQLMELAKRLEDGAIGDVLAVSSSYSGGRPNKMPDPKFKPENMTDMQWALKYWQNFLELSGDGILEFMIHGIDKMTWFMGNPMPAKCYATGANLNPVKGANNWDNFSLRFIYDDGRVANFFGRQIRGTYAASGDIITGSAGQAHVQGKKATISKDGKVVWQSSGGLGYVNEHKIFTTHIRKGEVFNDVIDMMANSHAAAIMGRTAAYTGQLLSGKQLMESKDEFIKDIKNLNYDTPFVARPSAHPGKTKFV